MDLNNHFHQPAIPILSGCIAWYDAGMVNGPLASPPSDGDALVNWIDMSGWSHNLTAYTSAPVFKTNILNGYSVARFSGGQGMWWRNLGVSTSFPISRATRSLTGFTGHVVNKSTTNTGTSECFRLSNATNGGARIVIGRNDASFNQGGRRLDADSFQNINVSTAVIGTWYLQTFVVDLIAATYSVYINGSSVGTGAYFTSGAGSATNDQNYAIGFTGSTSFFSGDIALVVAYNTAHTSDQLTTFTNYVRNRYNFF